MMIDLRGITDIMKLQLNTVRAQIRATDKASQASIERSVAWLFAFTLFS